MVLTICIVRCDGELLQLQMQPNDGMKDICSAPRRDDVVLNDCRSLKKRSSLQTDVQLLPLTHTVHTKIPRQPIYSNSGATLPTYYTLQMLHNTQLKLFDVPLRIGPRSSSCHSFAAVGGWRQGWRRAGRCNQTLSRNVFDEANF